MNPHSSRRNFLAAGMAIPAAALGSRTSRPSPAGSRGPDLRLTPAAASGGALTYRVLGKTGLKVTSVGFGCMITSDATVIERAADAGITYFDTARGYQSGNNERMVGAALKNYRKKIVLSTKTGAQDAATAMEHLETSLRELGTDYVDIWYLHARSQPDQITGELLDAQDRAKQQGKIRFAGVSTHSGQKELMPFLVRRGKTDVILTSYNFTMENWIDDSIAQAAEAGLGIVAMKVMAGGFRRIRPNDPLYEKFKQPGVMLAALKWALSNQNVHTTIPSMTDMDQLDENLKAMTAPFQEPDRRLLARQLEAITPLYCRMCGRCEGTCAKGLPVDDLIRFVTYAEGYGQFPLGRERFQELPRELQCVRCADCQECTVHCPHGVDVAGRVSLAAEYFA